MDDWTLAIVCLTRIATSSKIRSARSTCSRGERRRAGGVAADGVQVAENRPDVGLHAIGQSLHPADGRARGDHEPICAMAMASVATAMTPRKTSRHTLTRCPAAPADTPRVRARSRSSAFRAPDSADALLGRFRRVRPSRAFCRDTRASPSAGRGRHSSATAAPLTAPRMNASRMLPAPAPSSLAIRRCSLSR